jgi:hypothetical protein
MGLLTRSVACTEGWSGDSNTATDWKVVSKEVSMRIIHTGWGNDYRSLDPDMALTQSNETESRTWLHLIKK